MLIPRFSLSQTATHLSITIRCPYVKFSTSNDDNSNGIEVDLPSPDEFYFACKPYYLHLYLPGRVIDKDSPDYKYDIDTSSFCFNYEKEMPNEHFQDLDMLTKLLNKNNKVVLNKVEEVDQILHDEQEESDEDEPLWNQMRQLEIDDQPKETLTSIYSYGFNHQYKDILSNFDSEYSLIFDNQSPDTLPTSSIRSCRLEKEQLDFNYEYYLADKHESHDEILFNYKLTIDNELNDQDRDDLKNLKYKQYLIDDQIPIYLGLIDILYAFAYDQRLTQGEPCCESPWNIHKLSSTLSWFDCFTDLPSVLIACCRRTLIYPLIRSFKLARKCLLDVIEILSMGKCAILQCLLQMRRLFLDEEHRYLLNTLYLNDYCIWIQTECHTKWLNSLIEAMKHTIDGELEEDGLELNFEEKTFSWKVNLCEANDSDDDDTQSSSSSEEAEEKSC